MKIKASRGTTSLRLTLDPVEAAALFWSIRPDRLPESMVNSYQDIAREIERDLGEALEVNGIDY